jgi:hypothetical protein
MASKLEGEDIINIILLQPLMWKPHKLLAFGLSTAESVGNVCNKSNTKLRGKPIFESVRRFYGFSSRI